MSSSKPIPILLATMLISSCAAWNHEAAKTQSGLVISEQSGQSAAARDSSGETMILGLIARDFVNAMKQLDELDPLQTTVQLLNADGGEFTQALEQALQDSGFGVRRVQDVAGVGALLQYRHAEESTSHGYQRELYEVAIGAIEMRRTYLTDGSQTISPVTPLYIRGADATNVVLNDTLFEAKAVQSLATANVSPPKNSATGTTGNIADQRKPELASRVNGLVSPSTLAVPPEANPLGQLTSASGSANPLSLPLVALPRIENVFELGGSNYEKELANHHIVAEQILTFANDSLRLGKVNKVFINRLVAQFDEHRDVFSIIGCSLGPTQLKSGNAALALGRASRVKEALLFAGIEEANILDEGCWAGDSGKINMPRRGVVVTLKRKI